jgi:hypothetical protein
VLSSGLKPWMLSIMRNGECWRKRAVVLAVAMIFLTGCATGSSDQRRAVVCPPVVDYSREEQRRVAEEVEGLPEGSTIVKWLADYAVLRAQVRVVEQCSPR